MQEEDIPAEEEREKEPLEKVIGTLMHDPSSYETDLKLFLEEGNENFSMQQIEDFIKDQKWRNESKLLFKQVWLCINECWRLLVSTLFQI